MLFSHRTVPLNIPIILLSFKMMLLKGDSLLFMQLNTHLFAFRIIGSTQSALKVDVQIHTFRFDPVIANI